ncbi:polysaccharide deacetylase family protein [Paractinoplanes atraurantiacus]|uniref:Polysaccharide deacetylase n=1 Tax=Paractinoplanes atraurantiacus TaxID=1036182 RepID=A0A285FB10_9ACTN|nr:polysaccharide deacetylase family protein [Actinoplanes atraurantiacus]SNY08498.1 Polysaccharide deacetylase [Actinoplanes atraurantiacus]
MSPQSPRYPTPAGQTTRGRHHRPESLADVTSEHPIIESSAPDASPVAVIDRPETRYRRGKPVVSFVGDDASGSPASLPRQRGATRGQRPTRAGRHAVAKPPAQRPPTMGSHRAPGTLPIESWLLMGKSRQQVLLASLVAIGILLLAMPAEQRRESVNAVNAAAQAVVGVQPKPSKAAPVKDDEEPTRSKPAGNKDEKPAADIPAASGDDAAAPQPTAAVPTVAPSATPAAQQTGESAPKVPPAGPGASLRTTGTEAVALTFDDGPDPVQTPKILALLAKNDVKAVFCLVGSQVKKHPEIVRQIVDAGHTLCNHTWDHSLKIGKDKPEKIKADLDRTNAAIRAAVPGAEIPFFRAPGGNFTDRLVAVAGGAGMTSIYWEVDPRDWDHPEGETDAQHVDRVIAEVQKSVKPGAIVLSHDFGQPDTIAAYEKLLPWFKANFTLGLPQIPGPPPSALPTQTPPAPAVTPSATPPAGT